MRSCVCRLQIVSITVGNVVIHCGHCVSTTTCFLPFGTPYFIGLFVFRFFLGFHDPWQIDLSSSLALYL